VAQFVSRVVNHQEKKAHAVSEVGALWVASHPALWEYLTLDSYEDGAPREVSMLLLFAEDGRFKAALQDRQEGRSLWSTAESIEGALMSLEAMLQSGMGEWRQMKGGNVKGGKRK